MHRLSLDGEWTVRAGAGPVPADIAERSVAAIVPGCVHTDLGRAGLIPDPFDGGNEASLHWIGESEWRYERTFRFGDPASAERHDLVAEGLDTFATIRVNGAVVGSSQNQFRPHRFDIGEHLVAGTNTISVTFAAPVPTARAHARMQGARPHANHHPYNAVRKMASNFGWDWGIDAATSGIWRSIRIESWSGVRIASVRPLVDVEGTTGLLDAHVDLEWSEGASEPVSLVLTAAGIARSTRTVHPGEAGVLLRAIVEDVRLWWPRGHGGQPLYDVAVTVERSWTAETAEGAEGAEGADAADEWAGRVGFRTVELDTRPDEHGTPFRVKVNGRLVLIRGANWIPDHAFLTEIDRGRYRRRVDDAVEANVNLLRVWGGGIYESRDFYDACDEAGVLVWQDFLFACAAYAEEGQLALEVEAEARSAIARLSQHASLVIWNGNNENIWGYVDWGWQQRLAGRSWGDGYYRHLLPELIAELDPTRPYSPGSPYSFSEYRHPNDQAHGTMHIWDVWNQRDYLAYAEYAPRFVSEFGFQGPPAWTTMTDVVHDEPLDPYGVQLLVHQKAADGNVKLERGLAGHLPEPASFDDWHWATQLNQAMAVRFGIERFRSLTPLNTGTIVWQLNDNWPVISWAAVDFAERRKPLWYALRDAYRPRLLTLQPEEDSLVAVFVNDHEDAWSGRVRLRRSSFDGTVLAEATVSVLVEARGVARVPVPEPIARPETATREVVVAEAFADAEEPADDGFGRAMYHFAEVIDQELDPGAVTAEAFEGPAGYVVRVTATSLARDVMLLADRAHRSFGVDRGLVTLLAGESVEFEVTGEPGIDPAPLTERAVLRHANGRTAAHIPAERASTLWA